MIKTENLITTVTFGTEEKANIAVVVHSTSTTLILQQLVSEKKFGDKLVDEDIKDLPKIEMDFFDIKSVDVMIKALERIKNNLSAQNTVFQLALAC